MNKDTEEHLQAQAQELEVLSKIAEDWSHYARALIWLDRGEEAAPVLERQLEQHPGNVEALRALAFIRGNSGSSERAEELLDRAISLNPNSGILFLDKGDLLARAKRDHEALEAYDSAAFLDADLLPVIAVHKARALVRLEEFEAACEVLSPHLDEGELIEGIFYIYGLALANQKRVAEALEYFDKAVAAFENDAFAWRRKGAAMCSLGMYEQAIGALDRSLVLAPADERSLHYRGEALLAMKRYSEAVETLPPESLSHNIFHEVLKIVNSRPKQGSLQQQLSELQRAHDSAVWRDAFLGGLVELASVGAKFDNPEKVGYLQIWNDALHELFADQQQFSILLTLFEVLTRVKVHGDRKALLELPREQRLLLIGRDEDSLGTDRGTTEPTP
jgi:Flp pilus assembly protein TadD